MNRRFSKCIHPVLVFWLLVAATAGAWEVVQFDERDYVTATSIKEFYRFDSVQRNDDAVTLENKAVTMKFVVGGRDCYMNNVRFVLSHEVESQGDEVLVSRIDLAKLVDPVLRPNFIKHADGFAGGLRTVIVDPAHGGKDRGVVNSHGSEAGYTLALAERVKELLEERGFKVLLTRAEDRKLSVAERLKVANKVAGAAVFISLGFRTGESTERGIRCYTLAPQGVPDEGRELRESDFEASEGNAHDAANIALATGVQGSVLRRLGANTFDQGIRRARPAILAGLRHPGVLFEGGFMSHPEEARLIDKEAYQKAVARGIADAVMKFRHATSRGEAEE